MDDPCDPFDGWRWSCTAWVTADSDPCDEWPTLRVGGECFFISSFGVDFGVADAIAVIASSDMAGYKTIVIDSYAHDYVSKPEPREDYFSAEYVASLRRELQRELNAANVEKPYDFRKHDKVKGKRGRW